MPSRGIHEEYVRLLHAIVQELTKSSGTDLPTAWISSFYGSGKSAFAKLLGLALDGVALTPAIITPPMEPGKALPWLGTDQRRRIISRRIASGTEITNCPASIFTATGARRVH